jgi:hypothetical protein
MLKSNDVFTKESQVDSLNLINKDQEAMLQSCINTLQDLKKSGTITEDSYRRVANAWRELDALREVFFLRIINSLKRGDMILR